MGWGQARWELQPGWQGTWNGPRGCGTAWARRALPALCPGPPRDPGPVGVSRPERLCQPPGGGFWLRGGRAGGLGEFGLQAGAGGSSGVCASEHCSGCSQGGPGLRWCRWFLTVQAYMLILTVFAFKRENEEEIIRRMSVSEANRTLTLGVA